MQRENRDILKINVFAQDAFHASQQAKAIYGDKLLPEFAALDPD